MIFTNKNASNFGIFPLPKEFHPNLKIWPAPSMMMFILILLKSFLK